MTSNILSKNQYLALKEDIGQIINNGKIQAQNKAKYELLKTYWLVGKKINQQNLSQNANYRNLILEDLTNDLGLERTVLGRCINFFKTYAAIPKYENLTWSHYKYLIAVKDQKQRQDLEEKAADENWSVNKIASEVKNGKIFKQNLDAPKQMIRPKNPSYLYLAKIIDVIDGDTLLVNIDLGFAVFKKQRVRLNQIDAPEKQSEAGRKSFEYLRDLAANIDVVTIKTNKIDIYGRYLADVFYLNENKTQQMTQADIFEKGVYLNEHIVTGGHAVIL